MSKRSAAESKKFHIQLIADKNVVLVEAEGYESEIFVPQFQRGRIRLANVICGRQLSVQVSDISLHTPLALQRRQRVASRKLTTATAGLTPTKVSSAAISRASMSGNFAGTGPKNRFILKLISNGNVVLAECNGYESEIFLPHICSRCIAMKRVSAGELAQYACRISIKEKPKQHSAAAMAASLAAQAVGLSNMLIYPIQLTDGDQKAKLPPAKLRKKQSNKHHSKESGDA